MASDVTSGMGPYDVFAVFSLTRTDVSNLLGVCAALADALSGSLV